MVDAINIIFLEFLKCFPPNRKYTVLQNRSFSWEAVIWMFLPPQDKTAFVELITSRGQLESIIICTTAAGLALGPREETLLPLVLSTPSRSSNSYSIHNVSLFVTIQYIMEQAVNVYQ